MDTPKLIAGPYNTPRIKVGRSRPGLVLAQGGSIDGPHVVRGLTDAPIPWPWTVATGSRRQLIVFGGLEHAIHTESAQAVAHWWGVSLSWVERARRVLGVPRMNRGTKQLWTDLAPVRLANARAPRQFDDDEIAQVRERAAAGESRSALCAEFGFSRAYLSLVLQGRRRAK